MKIENIQSDECIINRGVPQGAILSPTLFKIFVNDIFDYNIDGKIISYADDNIIVISEDTYEKLEVKMNKEFVKINSWYEKNDLSINKKN